MKAIKMQLAGKEYYLALTGTAKFAIDDLQGGDSIINLIQPNTKSALDILCNVAAILMEQGELARRFAGYDKSTYLSADAIKALLSPSEVVSLKLDVARALLLGYNREIEAEGNEKAVDIVLQELEKKTRD